MPRAAADDYRDRIRRLPPRQDERSLCVINILAPEERIDDRATLQERQLAVMAVVDQPDRQVRKPLAPDSAACSEPIER